MPDDDAPVADETEAPEAGPEPPPEPGRLLVFGCAKMFEEMLLQQPAHGLLLLNAVDALSLGDDLIRIRSKQYDRRTFGEVSDGRKLTFRLLNVALVPVLVIVFWIVRRVAPTRSAAG